MLTPQENDSLCRVEGDAPMGQLMRRHWVPALLVEEVAGADGDPVPVRLFGEDLVAWRDTEGRVSLMDRYCPHRKASLQFGRNEDGGLRCLYHGWKVNVLGEVVEMPSEPPGVCAKQGLKHKTYPTREHGGFVWAYMGPSEAVPEFTPPPFAPHSDSRTSIAKIKVDCNWAQVLEGAIDSAHSSSLHSSDIAPGVAPGGVTGRTRPNGGTFLRPSTDKAPRIQVQATDYGFKYAALRRPIRQGDTQDYVRMTVYVAPFTVLIPPNSQYSVANVNVPIDDTHTMFHFVAYAPTPQHAGIEQEEFRKILMCQVGIDLDKSFTKKKNLGNSYLQDRQAMKLGSFTGIGGIPYQDIAMWETMGPIADRSVERLGASDQAIVHFRRSMLEAVREFTEGRPALGTPERSRVPQACIQSFEGILPKGAEWRGLDIVGADLPDTAPVPQS